MPYAMSSAIASNISSDAMPQPESDNLVWQRAVQVAVLFAIDPVGTGGVRLRAAAGPVRDLWLTLLRNLLGVATLRRAPASRSRTGA